MSAMAGLAIGAGIYFGLCQLASAITTLASVIATRESGRPRGRTYDA